MITKKNDEQVFENKLVLSTNGKRKYLSKLIGRVLKILHLIEEEETTKVTPEHFIYGQLIEVNSANMFFDGELTDIIIKLNYVYNNYKTAEFKDIRRQIFEIKNCINHILGELTEEGGHGEDN